jgi:hypothetical protein
MNTLMLATMMESPVGGGVKGLLIQFIIILIVLAIVGGLIYAIETWIIKAPLPNMVKLVIGLILVLLVIIWAIGAIG